MSKIFIGVPILNRLDLLEQAIAKYDYPHDLFVVNNNTVDPEFNTAFYALQERVGFDSFRARFNLGCSASWNRILVQALSRGEEFCYIGSNDCFLGPGMLQAFVELEKRPDEGLWMLHHFNFICIRLSILSRVGMFDENFYPAYREDDDFRHRCRLAGIKMVYLLNGDGLDGRPFPKVDVQHLHEQTIKSDPDYPKGDKAIMGSWGDDYYMRKWGGGYGHGPEKYTTPFNGDKPIWWWPDPGKTIAERDWDNVKRQRARETPMETVVIDEKDKAAAELRKRFKEYAASSGDIAEHVTLLYKLACVVDHVTELGTGFGGSTMAFLSAAPKQFHSYDRVKQPTISVLQQLAAAAGIPFVHHLEDTLQADIEPTDLMLVDTYHVYDQVRGELDRHADKVRRYLVFHDTETFGTRGEGGNPGIWGAVVDFLRQHPEWRLLQHYTNNNGLTVLERLAPTKDTKTAKEKAVPVQAPVKTLNEAYAKYRKMADDYIAGIGPYPEGRFQGRGIVICAGAKPYFTGGWIVVNLLRRMGCTLPVQFWHLGPKEMGPKMKALVQPLGVTCVDAEEVRKDHPVRMLNGWELKPFTLINCSFEEVMLIDADNVPLINPEILFETEGYKTLGCTFWPDRGRCKATDSLWEVFGVPYQDEPQWESGQIVLNKRRCWQPINLTMHYNEHSDFYFKHVHGDKETYHMAWRRLEVPFSMTKHGVHDVKFTMCQHDFDGKRIFQHRHIQKLQMDKENPRSPGFEREDECFELLKKLQQKWDGIIS